MCFDDQHGPHAVLTRLFAHAKEKKRKFASVPFEPAKRTISKTSMSLSQAARYALSQCQTTMQQCSKPHCRHALQT